MLLGILIGLFVGSLLGSLAMAFFVGSRRLSRPFDDDERDYSSY